ncbi:hypothetical protein RA27_21795 [Ruegeria sp. ANG-R]|nr:hypothetical protein RA27_21795 [Ruegeria sp. ANG-R]
MIHLTIRTRQASGAIAGDKAKLHLNKGAFVGRPSRLSEYFNRNRKTSAPRYLKTNICLLLSEY